MFASAYRVLLALVAAGFVALACTAMGWGVALLVLVAAVGVVIAWPLVRMLFAPNR